MARSLTAMTDGNGPTTNPPETAFDGPLSRFSRTLANACPECGAAVDVWINEGATRARGVCRDAGHTVEEADLR